MASITKTTAASHSGWDYGDGRIYMTGSCRETDVSGRYYVYGYGFGSLPEGAVVTGLYCNGHFAQQVWEYADQVTAQLCIATSLQGTEGIQNTVISPSTACPGGSEAWGGSTSLWGLTAAAMKTLVENANFGVCARKTAAGGTMYFSGWRVIVYYTLPPTGYTHDVNDVPAANIASVNEVPDVNIQSVNEVNT